MLRYGLDEIAAVEPRAGEDVELAEEAERLGHAEALASAAAAAHAALAGNPEDPEGVDAGTLVAGGQRALDAVRSYDPALAALADRIGEIGILLRDAAGDLAGYADDLDADPLRLSAVEERRAALTGLTRKYGEDIATVLAWAETSAARLTELDGDDERIGELTAERDALRSELGGLAQALTDARTEAAERFAAAVTAELASLAMPHARVSFDIRQTEDPEGVEVGGRAVAYGPAGADEVELLLAPHPGAPPRPIAKGASGGELSRVMLAVEVVFAGTDPVPMYLFDEVDAGVGGKAAVEIGRMARAPGEDRAGRGRDPSPAGGGLRRPAVAGREDQRRLGHPFRCEGVGGGGPGPGTVPHARGPGGLRDGPGACGGAAGDGSGGHVAGGRTDVRSHGRAGVPHLHSCG